jgi:aminoglycoside phosphotransferase (APT) family kinase protein
MPNLSKTHVGADILQAIAAHHLTQSLLSNRELHEGFFNASFLLEADNGQQYVLKVAPPPDVKVMQYEKDIMRAEVESMRLVRARTSVPVPEILCYDTSCRLLESEFFIMEFLPGRPYHHARQEFSATQQDLIDREIGGFVRQINDISGTGFGYAAGEKRFTGWRECFDAMLASALQDGQAMNVSLPLPYDVLHERLARHFHLLDEIKTPQLVHWDVWDGNVFVDPHTKRVSGLIDFERALWGDPLMEANFCEWDFHDGFITGYGCDMLDTPARRQRRLLYSVHRYLVMVIEAAYRQYETDDLENWSREQLVENLGQLEHY